MVLSLSKLKSMVEATPPPQPPHRADYRRAFELPAASSELRPRDGFRGLLVSPAPRVTGSVPRALLDSPRGKPAPHPPPAARAAPPPPLALSMDFRTRPAVQPSRPTRVPPRSPAAAALPFSTFADPSAFFFDTLPLRARQKDSLFPPPRIQLGGRPKSVSIIASAPPAASAYRAPLPGGGCAEATSASWHALGGAQCGAAAYGRDSHDGRCRGSPVKVGSIAAASGKAETVAAPPMKAGATALSQVKAEASAAAPGKVETVAPASPRKEVETVVAPPGKEQTAAASPGKAEAIALSPGKTRTVAVSPGKTRTVAVSPGKTRTAAVSPGNAEAAAASGGCKVVVRLLVASGERSGASHDCSSVQVRMSPEDKAAPPPTQHEEACHGSPAKLGGRSVPASPYSSERRRVAQAPWPSSPPKATSKPKKPPSSPPPTLRHMRSSQNTPRRGGGDAAEQTMAKSLRQDPPLRAVQSQIDISIATVGKELQAPKIVVDLGEEMKHPPDFCISSAPFKRDDAICKSYVNLEDGGVHGRVQAGALTVRFCVPDGKGKPTAEASYLVSLAEGDPPPHAKVQRVSCFDAASATVLDVTISGRGHATLMAAFRQASATETRRHEARRALEQAEMGDSYDALHAQIVKARARGVEASRLERAAARLKKLQPHGATKEELHAQLAWRRVVCAAEGAPPLCSACEREGCGMQAAARLPGAEMHITRAAVDQALASAHSAAGGVPLDRWFFESLVKAAAASAAEGGVWRAGGKLIFSAPSRNQSPVALLRYLETAGHSEAVAALRALVGWTERTYDKSVSAVQINLHLDASSFHAQHRDIYGLEQRDNAGRDCTCSFKPNVATACLSLGSSRRCLVQSETDALSDLKKCCDECAGYSCTHWLRSGDLMYFNDVWNRSYTHGIPPHDEARDGPGGPRISIALLCAEPAPKDMLCILPPRSKQKIFGLLMPPGPTTSPTKGSRG